MRTPCTTGFRVRTTLPDGRTMALEITTGYPGEGRVRIVVVEDAEFALTLRVPAWATGAVLVVDGDETRVEPGIAVVRRSFRASDVVELTLPLEPRVTHPDPRVDAVRGSIAIERGPEVLALESLDLDADVVDAVIVGAPVEKGGRVVVALRNRTTDDVAEVPLLPYHDWALRGPSTMRVWLPTT